MEKNKTTAEILENSRQQFNVLLGNMVLFAPDDMEMYDACYKKVFGGGLTFSYMSATFFAQFAAEILLGMLSSNPLRRFLVDILDKEAAWDGPNEYWDPSMEKLRFGLPGVDYKDDIKELRGMMDDSYMKILSLNEWYGTDEGKHEFEMYCLSNRAVRDLKRIVLEFPYLIRRYDFDQRFAGEIMEYAGVVAEQVRRAAEEA